MIPSIIQIFVMAIFFFAIFRESKRDRLRDMQTIDDIRKFFDLQAEDIARQAKQLSSVIKELIENNNELIYEQAKSTRSFIHIKLEDIIPILYDIEKNIVVSQDDTNSQFSILNERLLALETPVKLWGQAATKNEIKKGEANRTLRNKLKLKQQYINDLEQSLNVALASNDELSIQLKRLNSELNQAKSAAHDILDESMKEISLIRSWMDSCGVPCQPLDKLLSQEFKGNIPSLIYSRKKDEHTLLNSLAEEPLSI